MPGRNSSPRRIASLLPGATEILFALGLGDRVVAVSHECDWPPQARALPRLTRTRIDSSLPSASIDDEVRRLLAAGESLYEVDRALLETLAPDLLITQAQCDVCAVKLADVEAAVSGCEIVGGTQIVALQPLSLAEILADIGRVAAAAGVEPAGVRVAAELQARLDRVAETVAVVPRADRPRVAALEWLAPLMLGGNWMPELISRAGGISLVEKWGEASRYVEWEEIVAADPEVILVMPCGFDLQRAAREAESLRERKGWPELRAVKSGRVYLVDGNAWFNRAGPRSIESLEILAHLLHPDRMPVPRLTSDVLAFARWK